MFYLQHRPGFSISDSSAAVSSSSCVVGSEDDGSEGGNGAGGWDGRGCSSHADAGCCGSTPCLPLVSTVSFPFSLWFDRDLQPSSAMV